MSLDIQSVFIEAPLLPSNAAASLEPLRAMLVGQSCTVIGHRPSRTDGTPSSYVMRGVNITSAILDHMSGKHMTIQIRGDKIDIRVPIGEGLMGSSDETPPNAGIYIEDGIVCLTYATKLGRHYITIIP